MSDRSAPRLERESVQQIRIHNGSRALQQRTDAWGDLSDMLQRPEWQQRAACRGIGPDHSHPDSPRQDRLGGWTKATTAFITNYCDRCAVREECLSFALKHETSHSATGIWGGLTPTARLRLKNGQTLGRVHSGAECGTAAGYQRHYRRGEKACADCIQAHSAASRRYEDAARLRRLAEKRGAQ